MTDYRQRFQPGATVRAGETSYSVRRSRTHRDTLLLELEGVRTRDQAEELRGTLLEVPEEDLAPLEENQYFRFQVVGMAVFEEDGTPLGLVEEVLETGANDVYIVRDQHSELLIPAIDIVVKEVDVPGRRMVVQLIAGLEQRPLKPPRPR